jgi:threonine dehydratase
MVLEANYLPLTADDVLLARETLRGVVYHTPIVPSEPLSALTGYRVFLKLENTQKTGAFKLRGAYHTIASLTHAERQRGLIAASSGNHAQGVAYSARAFGIADKTKIYMPASTPQTKIDNTRQYGVRVELVQGNYDACSTLAHAEAETTGATYIEPYNDWRIMAGQGTVGLEIADDLPDVDAVLCPVGGGGLIAGIALALHARLPHARVIGVQGQYAQPDGYTIADGIRVSHPGDKPMQVIRQHVDQLLRMDEAHISEAVVYLAQRAKVLVEGAGAVGVAALLSQAVTLAPQSRVLVVLSGGNIDLLRLAALIQT